MKLKLKNGEVQEVEHDAAVLLVASGQAERAEPEPAEEPKKTSKKAKE